MKSGANAFKTMGQICKNYGAKWSKQWGKCAKNDWANLQRASNTQSKKPPSLCVCFCLCVPVSVSVCLSAPVGLERQTRGNLLLKRAKEAAAASHQWKPQMGGEQLKAKILSHDMGMMLARITDARKLR